jgi:hypothetical protein
MLYYLQYKVNFFKNSAKSVYATQIWIKDANLRNIKMSADPDPRTAIDLK